MKIIRDIKTILLLNVKCFLANKLAVITLLLVSAVFVIVSTGFVKEYDKKTSLGIGVYDKDQSESSRKLVEGVKQTEGFTVHEWSVKELNKALEEETIYAYFVIEDGLEEKIKSADTKQIISMYYLYDYNFVSILSDIFAKSIMEDLMLYQGKKLYEDNIRDYDLVKETEYIPYMEQSELINADGFFEYDYVKVAEGKISNSIETKNSILTTQIYLGVATLFLSFISMFLVLCQRRHKEVEKRMRICLISTRIMENSNLLSLFIWESLVLLGVSWYMGELLRLSTVTEKACLLGALILFTWVMTTGFAILSKLISRDTLFQFVGVILIFFMGGVSIMASIGQITVPFLNSFAKNMPNYWFISHIIDIILADKPSIRFFPVVMLVLLAFIYNIITDIKLRVLAR
ncbi:MAG: ABC transporter permease [bacterium]|nr:ABC transporter permease [bacterium]